MAASAATVTVSETAQPPDSLVLACRVKFVSKLVMVTAAPVTAASLVSRKLPTMDPKSTCGRAVRAANITNRTRKVPAHNDLVYYFPVSAPLSDVGPQSAMACVAAF